MKVPAGAIGVTALTMVAFMAAVVLGPTMPAPGLVGEATMPCLIWKAMTAALVKGPKNPVVSAEDGTDACTDCPGGYRSD